MSDSFEFSGVITALAKWSASAIVTLDEPVEGRKYAVIGDGTVGRIALMNTTPDGHLPKGAHVTGTGHLGPDAIMARHVAPSPTIEE